MSGLKHTVHGRVCRPLTTMTDGRIVVELGYEDENEPYFCGELAIVDRIFDEPPREAYHAEIEKLEAKKVELSATLHQLRHQVSEVERTHKDRIAKLKNYEQLQLVEEFLDGKITHYVIVDTYDGCNVRISTPQEEKCGDDRRSWNAKLKLLVLYGDQQNRTIDWLLHYYSDGSGSRTDMVYAFTSHGDAKAKAATLIAAAFDVVRKTPDWYRARHAIGSAKAIGIEVPADVLAICREHEAKAARANVEKAREELAAAEQALATTQGAAP